MRLIRYAALTLAVLFTSANFIQGQETSESTDAVQEIMEAYQTEMQALGQRFNSTDDQAERDKILQEELPALQKGAFDQCVELEAANSGEELGARAMALALAFAPDEASQKTAKDQILTTYVNFAGIAESLVVVGQDAEMLQTIVDTSENHTVIGVAKYFLINLDKGGGLNEANEEELIPRMEELVAEYGDVQLIYPGGQMMGTLGEMVDNEVFAYKNLRIGKVAPDIEGEDLDGVEFKLSDYRGKVVVIDFWGDW